MFELIFSCLLQTHCHLVTKEKPSASWQLFDTYRVINYGSGWREDVVKLCSGAEAGGEPEKLRHIADS